MATGFICSRTCPSHLPLALEELSYSRRVAEAVAWLSGRATTDRATQNRKWFRTARTWSEPFRKGSLRLSRHSSSA